MGKQHLYLLALLSGSFIFVCPSKSPSDIAGIFLNVTRNLPRHSIWATSRLKFADITILLARSVTTRAVRPDAGARRGIGAPKPNQLFSSEADIAIGIGFLAQARHGMTLAPRFIFSHLSAHQAIMRTRASCPESRPRWRRKCSHPPPSDSLKRRSRGLAARTETSVRGMLVCKKLASSGYQRKHQQFYRTLTDALGPLRTSN